MGSHGLALAPPAKNVVVYRNGDPFFPGRKIVVNHRRFLTFEAFLNEVTKSVRAPLAVRNLYTPRHGHRIAELRDLQDGCQYVAAGFEKFKRLDYLSHGRKELCGTRNSDGLQVSPGAEQGQMGVQNEPGGGKDLCSEVCWQFWNVLSYVKSLSSLGVADNKPHLAAASMEAGRFHTVAPWKSNVPARWQKHTHLPCMIHVFRNGDLLSPPFPLLLSKSTPLQWDTLLATLTEKANLRSGAVNKLCRLDGTQVSGGEELVSGDYYVAVGNEEYKKLPYLELLVPRDSVCGKLCLVNSVPPPRTELVTLLLLNHLNRQNRRSNRNVQCWPDQEESAYKTRGPRKEMQCAQEVKGDEHTRVDVPIDQV
nr:PREDICTED: doublecortin domain-containing protein 2B [Phalacrocorax carbo]